MYYEINVSHMGLHYFATAERSITSSVDLKRKVRHFKELFPEDDGYKVTASWWNKSGAEIDLDDLLKEGK